RRPDAVRHAAGAGPREMAAREDAVAVVGQDLVAGPRRPAGVVVVEYGRPGGATWAGWTATSPRTTSPSPTRTLVWPGRCPGVSKATTPSASSASPSTSVAPGSGRPRSADSAMLSRCATNGTPSK